MKNLIVRAQQFIKKDIWHIKLSKLPKWKAHGYRTIRILLLTYQGFSKSQIQQGASALTYYSLLAIVPIVALLIGVGRAFRFEKTLENYLTQHFVEQTSVIQQIFKYANASLEQARGGVIAGIGIVILIWSTVKILAYIEYVLNQIWEVEKGRPLARKFTDYLAMVFLAPVIVFLATGLTGYLSALLSVMHKGTVLEHVASILIYVFSFLSFFLISLLFIFLYIFMPNTRVRLSPALIAGLLTGATYQFLQWLYFYFQIGVASYNAIYGTFAAFPLFLVWLHLSWVITLIGAKLCFAIQNVDAYEFITEEVELSHKTRIICALRIAHCCVKRFVKNKPPLTLIEISNELEIPLFLTSQLAHQLVKAEVLSITKREDQEEAFQPARNLENLTLKKVIDLLNERGENIPLPQSHEIALILKHLENFDGLIEKSEYNILLRNI